MATEKLSPGALLTKAKPKRAAIYARVSTGDQHLETQLLDLREMAKQRGYEIAQEYRDVISGARAKRPGLDQLLADARRHRFDIVLVAAFDRVARSVRHFLEVLDELGHLNIEFVSLRENIDTGGPLGRAIVVIVGAIAELEKSLIVERVRAGMRRARLEGRRIGRAPLNIDRAQVVADRLSGTSLTSVAKKYHVSRATVCRLVNEAGGLKKPNVPPLVPPTDSSNLPAAA
jgi:DNA invertase Pin-like site-specific DNA recombinase